MSATHSGRGPTDYLLTPAQRSDAIGKLRRKLLVLTEQIAAAEKSAERIRARLKLTEQDLIELQRDRGGQR